MKSISASIIVLSSVMLVTGSAYIEKSTTIMVAGFVLGVIGLIAWVKAFRDFDNP